MAIKVSNQKVLIITFIACALSLGTLFATKNIKPRYYVNFSNSEPRGIYLLIPFNGSLKRGERVILEPPNQASSYLYERGWIPNGGLLIKNVGALPGDRIFISDKAIFINNRNIGPVSAHDSKGLPLPRLRGGFNIGHGLFLPISPYIPNSFDGRYFGPVPFRLIRGKAVLVIGF